MKYEKKTIRAALLCGCSCGVLGIILGVRGHFTVFTTHFVCVCIAHLARHCNMLFTQQHYTDGMHRCGWFIRQALLKGLLA
jgi:hypothetical protein